MTSSESPWWLPGDPHPVLCRSVAHAVREYARMVESDAALGPRPHTCPKCGISHGLHQYNCPAARAAQPQETSADAK